MSKKNETKPLKQPAVRRSKIKVIHGTFAEEPKCKICNVDISHEWLCGAGRAHSIFLRKI